MSAPNVGPRDCALAVCVPISRRAFLADLEGSGAHDFAWQRFQRLGTDEEDAWQEYRPTSELVCGVCQRARCLGVTVRPEARLNDLTTLAERYQVVSLVAHCNFPKITAADLLDPLGLLAALRTPRGRVQEAVRDIFRDSRQELLAPEALSRMPFEELRGAVAAQIETIATEAHAWYDREPPAPAAGDVGAGDGSPVPAVRLTRPALEEAFPRMIVPGRAVEFRDGMKTVGEVCAAIPPAFTGFLDLTVCTSAVLAAAVRRRRSSYLVVSSQFKAEINVRIWLYRVRIDELARRPRPFDEALLDVQKALTEVLLDEQTDDRPGEIP